MQRQAERKLAVKVALAAECGLVLRHRIRVRGVGNTLGLGGVRAERLYLHAEVATAQFGVGSDRHGAGGLGDCLPLVPGGLDGGEHLRFLGGLGFEGSPDRGELPVPACRLLILCGAGFVVGSDGVDVGIACGGAHETEFLGDVRGCPAGFAFVGAAA